jgi:hypothetical protein
MCLRMDVEEKMRGPGLGSAGISQGPVLQCCEHGNGREGCKKGGERYRQLSTISLSCSSLTIKTSTTESTLSTTFN